MATAISVALLVVSFFFEAAWRTGFLCGAVLAILVAGYCAWARKRLAVVGLGAQLASLKDESDPISRVLIRLSEDAKELLIWASQDKRGQIWRVVNNVFSISTNEREFVETGNPRSEARWDGALAELLNVGTLKKLSDKGFQVTSVGYGTAEQLQHQRGK